MQRLEFSYNVLISVDEATGNVIASSEAHRVAFTVPKGGISVYAKRITLSPQWQGTQEDREWGHHTITLRRAERTVGQSYWVLLTSDAAVWHFLYEEPIKRREVRFPGPDIFRPY
jgi:hypothetical protein